MKSLARWDLLATAPLSGCSWTSRDAGPSKDATPNPSASPAPGTDLEAGEATSVDDGLLLMEGASFMMGSPEDEPWRVGDEARRDQSQQAHPAHTTSIDDIVQYDTIWLGYPNWWAYIPMPIATFLESYDLSGKTILPFCSNGGGGLGQSVTAISKLAPAARIAQGLSIYYSGGSDMSRQVEEWISSQGHKN